MEKSTEDKKNKAARAIRRWWPSTLTLALVLWLTLSPDPAPDVELPSWLGEYADKIVHAIMFGGLTGAIIFDYKRRLPGAPRPLYTGFTSALTIAMIIFSILDEWLQGAMGLGRAADIYDIAADLAGIAIALLSAPPVCNSLIRQAVASHSKS
ncbi:MAG: VanZ family protein [Muribaculaceae bacterium]